ncbi:MAG: acyl transferase [Sphingobacterium sp.]
MGIIDRIFKIHEKEEFNRCCLAVFAHQATENPVYRQYLNLLGIQVGDIDHYLKIPFLPIEFFKTQDVICRNLEPQVTFTSSGTTGTLNSRHLVADPDWYIKSFRTAFHQFYGAVQHTAILALLPSYSERSGSSLIYMVDDLIQRSLRQESGYFLYNHADLFARIEELKKKKVKTILFGVTYALLDFIEAHPIDASELVVMETGGMKGRRKEMIRPELHRILCEGFGVETIHSEYGMTELLSQAYSTGDGRFRSPSWMEVLIRDTNDPLTLVDQPRAGAVNIIDLANFHSCSFIATQDLGRCHNDGTFEILGRFDHSDIRGCNLLVQ